MSWAQRRRSSYILSFLFIVLLILSFVFFKVFNKKETCFDGIKNQNELGVDCGGSCTILCRAQYNDPIVLWTRWTKVTNLGIYNILAYVQNSNIGIGAYNAPYTFSLYDKDNVILYNKTDYTYISPGGNFFVFEDGIYINDRIPVRMEFSFLKNFVWQKIVNEELNIVAVSKTLIDKDTKPKLLVTVKNKSLESIDNIELVAILYDENANAITFSKTKVDSINKDSEEDVVFTWPEKFSEEVYKIEVISKVLKN